MQELLVLARAEKDEAVYQDVVQAVGVLHARTKRFEVETLLAQEVDAHDAYLEVHAGAGGTESQDWTAMLLRMYIRWAEVRKYQVEHIGSTPGEEAGMKSATLLIKGHNTYGWLKTEMGVHRLVRISPFDSASRRHTSFASVTVYPSVDDSIQIEINPADVRVDTYRASGAGGQHVNKTDSAVRLTHLPSGLVAQSQTQRSQHQNRAAAWALLRARLYEAELRRRREEQEARQKQKADVGWGSQIRSYVLYPYRMVKDLRTGIESPDPEAVLDGDIDPFIMAALARDPQA